MITSVCGKIRRTVIRRFPRLPDDVHVRECTVKIETRI